MSVAHIRGPDLLACVAKYLNGTYSTLEKPILPLEQESVFTSFQGKSKSETDHDLSHFIPLYLNEPGAKNPFTVLRYMIDSRGVYQSVPYSLHHNCMYCLQNIHQALANKEDQGKPVTPWGIPFALEEITTDGPNGSDGEKKKVLSVIDIFCSAECMNVELLTRYRLYPEKYEHSLELFKQMYEERTGKRYANINSPMDRRFLKTFNGTLDYDVYHANNAGYFSERNGHLCYLVGDQIIFKH